MHSPGALPNYAISIPISNTLGRDLSLNLPIQMQTSSSNGHFEPNKKRHQSGKLEIVFR